MSARRPERRLEGLLRWRKPILGCTGILAAFMALGVGSLATNNSPRVFFVEDSPGVARYDEFRRDFGGDKVVRIVVDGADLWTSAGLQELRRLEEGAEATPGVVEATGLWGHHTQSKGKGGARSGGEGAASRGQWPPTEPAAFRKRILANPLDLALGLISKDGAVATVLVNIEAASNAERSRILENLDELAAGVATELDVGVRLVGSPVLNRALDLSSKEITQRYLPLLGLLAVVLLALVFRRPAAVLIPLCFVAVTEVVPLGVMSYAGVELNLVLGVLPPLLFVIAMATAVHLLVGVRDRESKGSPRRVAVIETYRDKGWAVFWTGVSTLIGFASLATSRVAPVRDLGIWAAISIAVMTVLAFTLLPALLTLGGVEERSGSPDRRSFERFFRHRGRRWATASVTRRRGVLWVVGLLVLVGLVGVPRLRVETNALAYFPAGDPVRRDIEGLEALGIGSTVVELVLTRSDDSAAGGSGFRSLGEVEKLEKLGDALRGEALVLGTVGAGDLLADAVRSAPGGAFFGRATVRRVAFDRLVERGDFDRTITQDGRRARLTVLTKTVGTSGLRPLLSALKARAREAFPEVGVETTGEYPLVLETQYQLLKTLGLSLTLTLLAIGAIFRVLLRSWRLTVLAMLPNLWPVVGVLGIMGWSGTPLDVATVMVASVVLGLAVDDTIHTLGHFRELAPRIGCGEAVAGTLERTAASYVLTGLILFAGFGVCALSSFAPTARFGSLSALAIVLAVLGDLFLLPALLGCTPDEVARRLAKKG